MKIVIPKAKLRVETVSNKTISSWY
jgi:hypothetical protein